MHYLSEPVFCFTIDQEWASEDCLADALSLIEKYDIPLTVFVTHKSETLERSTAMGKIHLGLHPNFLPGSTHGSTDDEVIDHCLSLVPQADCFRCHAFYDNTYVLRNFYNRGFRYDSNLCLYLQENLVPLFHGTGLLRFPVFWEDDVHFCREEKSWRLEDYRNNFLSPGLKILNFHPMNISLNISDEKFLLEVKKGLPGNRMKTSASTLRQLSWQGPGTRIFLEQIIGLIKRENLIAKNLASLFRDNQHSMHNLCC